MTTSKKIMREIFPNASRAIAETGGPRRRRLRRHGASEFGQPSSTLPTPVAYPDAVLNPQGLPVSYPESQYVGPGAYSIVPSGTPAFNPNDSGVPYDQDVPPWLCPQDSYDNPCVDPFNGGIMQACAATPAGYLPVFITDGSVAPLNTPFGRSPYGIIPACEVLQQLMVSEHFTEFRQIGVTGTSTGAPLVMPLLSGQLPVGTHIHTMVIRFTISANMLTAVPLTTLNLTIAGLNAAGTPKDFGMALSTYNLELREGAMQSEFVLLMYSFVNAQAKAEPLSIANAWTVYGAGAYTADLTATLTGLPAGYVVNMYVEPRTSPYGQSIAHYARLKCMAAA
jgi:hypothetical protein